MRPGDYGAYEDKDQQRVVPNFVGAVVARRWFSVDENGVLAGAFRTTATYPPAGVAKQANTTYHAQCGADPMELLLNKLATMGWQGTVTYSGPGGVNQDPEHKIGAHDCSCGFYAYYKAPEPGDLVADGDYYVGGIVSCFGRMTYGDYGLRAQKLTLQALVLGYNGKPSFKGFWKWVWNLPPFVFVIGILFALLFSSFAFGISSLFTKDPQWWMLALTPLYWLWINVLAYRDRSNTYRLKSISYNKKRYKKLKANYPDLPVYKTWEEAEADFPHTKRKDLP